MKTLVDDKDKFLAIQIDEENEARFRFIFCNKNFEVFKSDWLTFTPIISEDENYNVE